MVAQLVDMELVVSAEDLVRALTGHDDLMAEVTHLFAQHVFGDAVHQDQVFVLHDCVDEVVGAHVAVHPEAVERRTSMLGHLLGDRGFVQIFLLERDRERSQRFGAQATGDPKHGARIEPPLR